MAGLVGRRWKSADGWTKRGSAVSAFVSLLAETQDEKPWVASPQTVLDPFQVFRFPPLGLWYRLWEKRCFPFLALTLLTYTCAAFCARMLFCTTVPRAFESAKPHI